MGRQLGLAVRVPRGTSSSHDHVPGLKPQRCFPSSFLLMHPLGTRRGASGPGQQPQPCRERSSAMRVLACVSWVAASGLVRGEGTLVF